MTYNCGSILNVKETIGHHNYPDLDLTFQGHPRSKVTVPKESPYMNLYQHLIVTGGLLCTTRKLQAIQVTLTSKVKCHNAKRKPIYKLLLAFNSYWGSIVHHKGIIGHSSYSDLDLTFQGHPRSNVMVPNERSYMTSYMLSMITLGLGCMVF